MRFPKLKFAVVVSLAIAAGCRSQSSDTDQTQAEEAVPASQEELLSLALDPGIKDSRDGQKNASMLHLMMSKRRAATHVDSVRARDLATKIKAALEKYTDTAVARADGYFSYFTAGGAGEVHFFNTRADRVNHGMTIDPNSPSALLYQRDSTGSLKLTGAMYSMPLSATPKDLEKVTPLSFATWHRHGNFCIPPLDHQERWTEKKDGRYVFGQLGYSTKKECDEVGGLFRGDLIGWMTHAYPFVSDDLAAIWGGPQMEMQMGGHQH